MKIAIVGAGPAGLFAAQKLSRAADEGKVDVTVFDKGEDIEKRAYA